MGLTYSWALTRLGDTMPHAQRHRATKCARHPRSSERGGRCVDYGLTAGRDS